MSNKMETIGLGLGSYTGETGYRGWVEPADKSWILFVRDDGTPELYTNRDPETGALIGGPAK